MTTKPARKPAVFGITGWKNSGKTRLVAGLVSELTNRGLTVSTIKHAHHGFDVDKPGTDSFAHREAGAKEVALVSGIRWVLMHELREEKEPTLDETLARLQPCDLVIIEGFKTYPHPKIEATRSETKRDQPIWPNDKTIVAVAADYPITNCDRKLFDLNDITTMADFVLDHLGIEKP
jgi:molybdopterin-guanine dinucleotide biosynthesis protein B